jgi:GH15 family glucan-1,4-alpha-glucosidase
MPRIEDYGLIGNTITAALVSKDGSIDWLCLPFFDSGACFAALLGTEENGYWRVAPAGDYKVSRAYREQTAILETSFETAEGSVTVIDFMPKRETIGRVDLIRIVRGVKGRVDMKSTLAFRFDYGEIVPWVRKIDGGILAISGPDAVRVTADVELHGENMATVSEFSVAAGETKHFCLTWYPSHFEAPASIDPEDFLHKTEDGWRAWLAKGKSLDAWNEAVQRSLITLKAMTFTPTGAIVAAPTTSLPERIGGERNWDYRYCWIRDSTLTLYAMLSAGYKDEAAAWREWLLRAAAGEPSKLQIMYGIRGERRLTELEIPWLPGYENSKPVRIGNGAHDQVQLDVYGELMDTLHVARKFELDTDGTAWQMQKAFIDYVEGAWRKPDAGIWEIRGEPQHFTYSKVMAWVALDRAIKGVEMFGRDGPVEQWRQTAAAIHADVCANAYNATKGCFVQAYGSDNLDASLLLIGQLGFVAADDPRFVATVEAVERELVQEGFVLRYRTGHTDDGLSGEEGAFLACSFWLVDAYVLIGRYDDAVALFERLLALRNDLGLLSEEYDAKTKRQLGNFPQAFSHIGLINSAHNLASHHPPAMDRADGKAEGG